MMAITKQALLKKFPVDRTLTYEKAKKQGYEWVEDLYLVENYKIPEEIPALLQKHKYILGRTHDDKNNNGIGLYRIRK